MDTFKFSDFPPVFTPVPLSGAAWNTKATGLGLTNNSGIVGQRENWDFLAYGAGDVDTSVCPSTGVLDNVAAGEPYNVSNDVNCD